MELIYLSQKIDRDQFGHAQIVNAIAKLQGINLKNTDIILDTISYEEEVVRILYKVVPASALTSATFSLRSIQFKEA